MRLINTVCTLYNTIQLLSNALSFQHVGVIIDFTSDFFLCLFSTVEGLVNYLISSQHLISSTTIL